MWSRLTSTFTRTRANAKASSFFKDGSFEITLGTVILSVYAIDRYLLYTRENNDSNNNEHIKLQEEQMRKAVIEQLRQDIQDDYRKSQLSQQQQQNKKATNEKNILPTMPMGHALLPTTPTLFRCKVRKIPAMFDGTMSLKGTHLGDILHVIQENVGPSGMYHLCRLDDTVNDANVDDKEQTNRKSRIGWFPISHLEKLDDDRAPTSD